MIKNLIYHITPIGTWRWNVSQLRERWALFDGIKVIAVATGGKNLESPSTVEKLFPDAEIIRVPNSPQLRETASFAPLLTTLHNLLIKKGIPLKTLTSENQDQVCLYAHTKGVTHQNNKAIKLWTQASYKYTLDNFYHVESSYLKPVAELLKTYPMCGPFKRYGNPIGFPKGGNNWHFSGTFFWFHLKNIFSFNWQKAILQHKYGVEAFPGMVYLPSETACTFGDGIGDLYNLLHVRDVFQKHRALEIYYQELKSLPKTTTIKSKEPLIIEGKYKMLFDTEIF